jgi:inner membrane protein
VVTLVAFPVGRPGFSRTRAWLYLFLATASHGLLDAFTDGGLGVALLSPFDQSRWFFAFRPIPVSPLGVEAFVSPHGASILSRELVWVWLPFSFVAVGALLWRGRPAIRSRSRPIG